MDNSKRKYTIDHDMTINDALILIEKNRHRSLIVLNNDKVVGTLSDGDIRRALINDAIGSIEASKIMNMNFRYLNSKITDNEKHKYFDGNDIFVVPIVNDNFKLIDILVKDIFN